MKNKAFTLIELLAVIVVLGIIMLIAVTAVSGVINNSKTNSFKTSAFMVAKQIRNEVLPMGYTNNQTIDCLSANYGLNSNNYDYCNAVVSNVKDVTKVYVDLIGKGSFAGLSIVGASMDSATVSTNATYSSLKTALLATVGTKDVDVNKYNGNGLYKWGSEYIYRGGITKTNSNGLTTADYATDVDSGSNPNNYVKVPWETYGGSEDCSNATTNKCWRVISINTDGSILIVRDKNESDQPFDDTHNTAASTNYSQPGTNYGYNDLLENIPTTGYPAEYRAYSDMYTYLYGTSGYQNTTLKSYFGLFNTIDVCINKVANYAGVNLATYSSTTSVTDTCNVSGKANTLEVNPLRGQYVRLPYTEEYLNATLESTCTANAQYQCRSQNFIYNRQTSWFLNAHYSTNNTWSVRMMSANGLSSSFDANNVRGIRPVVNLKSTVLITGGTGTTSDPYIIKS